MCLPKRAVRSTSILPVTLGQGSTALGKVVVPGGFLRALFFFFSVFPQSGDCPAAAGCCPSCLGEKDKKF
jgi:hypothetical protein